VFKPGVRTKASWLRLDGRQGPPGRHRRQRVAGGYNPNAVEVWQEALRIPAVKIVDRGKLRQDVWNLIFANVRLDIVQHDMKAEMGACEVGARRLVALLAKYGRRQLPTRTSRRSSTRRGA
jgi:N-methylhydantoinase B